MKIAKGGMSWIIPFIIFTLIIAIISLYVEGFFRYVLYFLFVLFLLISILLTIFFRDPDRKTGDGIVAVADGIVREIIKIKDKDIGDCWNISTFMNIQNVHVNRMAIDGIIKKITHIKGSHIPAFKKESEKNERVILLIKTDIGLVKIVQIAGTIARRIIPYVKVDDKVKKGERIGIIRLGSRVDLYLPIKKVKSVNVKVKQKIIAGVDSVAKIND